MHTHYIPYFTKMRNGIWQAVCGALVRAREHSSEPTCEQCQAWIVRTESEDNEIAAALEQEFPEYAGRLLNSTDE